MEALLRRPRQGDLRPVVLTDEFVEIDRVRHRVSVLGNEVALTPIEFRMLATFAENPGRVLGHGQLLELVWGDRIRERDEVKLYVSYLRRKLGGAADVDPVETVRGVGYRYRPRLVKATNGNGNGSGTATTATVTERALTHTVFPPAPELASVYAIHTSVMRDSDQGCRHRGQ